MPGDLNQLLPHLPAWLMVLFRLSGIFLLAPLLGSATIFRQVKVFLVLGLSMCVYPMLLDPARPSAQHLGAAIDMAWSIWTILGAIGLELLIGLVIGYCASLPLIGMQIGGQVIDQQLGLGLAGVYNPELGDQSGPMGEFLFLSATALFVLMGGHHILFITLVGSFDRVPLGGFTQFSSILALVLGLLTASFELAMRVALPLLCLIFLETLALGFIARTVPQLNILSVGFPLRILAGLMLLVPAAAIVLGVYTEHLQWTLLQLLRFFTLA